MTTISVPSPVDMHVHLREGAVSKLVTPHVKAGGIDVAYVMPNLTPPITTTARALAYRSDLQTLAPDVEFLMTLYLHPSITPEEIRKAHAAGIRGVKSYPRGVTTNSDGGIEDYESYYDVFGAMEQVGMVLNLHGEVPSDHDRGICVLNAEETFLAHLFKIHKAFPKLKIVLEHATTAAAVAAVKQCGDTVGCSITPHHLTLVVDDWAGQPFNFCKPVAKYPTDRKALRDVIASGHPRFFLGSDSAPHPAHSKTTSSPSVGCAAGVYTSPILLPLVANLLESFSALDKLQGFASLHGRAFYGLPLEGLDQITLRKVTDEKDEDAVKRFAFDGGEVVPFWEGKKLGWEIIRD
ncbi:dihydroorotase [Phaffia rhodozyma]|uniref:Dihydroorotase n=1 Tax=Phaffia rhodozyma TaxID=264483 RepID=A0A0F7SGR8_PHARH|nr:dihydroorotase [Phaffia rhodozyma]